MSEEINGIKISQMSEKSTIDGNEYIPIQEENSNKRIKTDLLQKKLVSGTDIKTFNGETLLGSGDIPVDAALDKSSNNAIRNGTVATKIEEITTNIDAKITELENQLSETITINNNENNAEYEYTAEQGDVIDINIENKGVDNYVQVKFKDSENNPCGATDTKLISNGGNINLQATLTRNCTKFVVSSSTTNINLTITLPNANSILHKINDVDIKASEAIENVNKASEDISSINKKLEAESLSVNVTQIEYSGNIDIPANVNISLTIKNNSDKSGYFRIRMYDTQNGNNLYDNNMILLDSLEEKTETIVLSEKSTYIVVNNINTIDVDIIYNWGISYEDIKKEVQKIPDIISNVGDSPVCYTAIDMTKTVYNGSKSENEEKLIFTKSGTSQSCNITFKNNTSVKEGDFIFVRLKIKSTVSEWIYVTTYSKATDQRSDYYYLDSNSEKEIYFRGAVANEAGTLNVAIQQNAVDNISASQWEISEIIICINHYDAYTGYENRKTLKTFSSANHTYTVDKNGGGHFYSISNAVNFLRNSFDVINSAYTVEVNNGLYNKEARDTTEIGYPNAIINKGSNRISIIGESRDNVVIEWTNNDIAQAKILDIGSSPCVIKNLTIRNLVGTMTAENNKKYNPYCIHIDLGGDFATERQYVTEVSNCKLYDEVHSPIGAGLTKNQVIRVADCEIISNGKIGLSAGALYIHANAGGTSENDATMGCMIYRNRLVSLDGTKALTLLDVGSSSYANIDCDIYANNLYTTGSEIIDSNFKSTHKLTEYSLGNNVEELNY